MATEIDISVFDAYQRKYFLTLSGSTPSSIALIRHRHASGTIQLTFRNQTIFFRFLVPRATRGSAICLFFSAQFRRKGENAEKSFFSSFSVAHKRIKLNVHQVERVCKCVGWYGVSQWAQWQQRCAKRVRQANGAKLVKNVQHVHRAVIQMSMTRLRARVAHPALWRRALVRRVARDAPMAKQVWTV